MRLALVIFSSAFLIGCATKNYSPKQLAKLNESKLYQLYIDEDGNLLNPGSSEIVDREEEVIYVNNILAEYQALKAANPKLKLAVFIHGGLNTFKSATERVEIFKDAMLNDDRYPLFISWNSGPFTNYKDHLFKNRRGVVSPLLGFLSSPFVFLEDGLRAIARIPASTYNVLFAQNTVRKSSSPKEKEAALAALSQLDSAGFNVYRSADQDGSFSDWATVWNPTKLITAPFIDGLGTGAWNSMLRRADLVLRKDSGFSGETKGEAHTAVTRFFSGFEDRYGQDQIDLIGHSMGAIIANNIIAKYPSLKFQNIVYMGAACRVKDLEYVVSPYLVNNPDSQFYNLSIHAYRELGENVFYDFVPRGSLLVWIDQTFGATNSFVDRTAGYWYNIVRSAQNVFKGQSIRKRVHLTEFARNGDVPKKHGAFDEFNFWQKKFWLGNQIERYRTKQSK